MTSSAKILYSATALLCALTLAGCGVSDADHSAQTDASPSASASVAQGKITRASDPAHSVSPGSIRTAGGDSSQSPEDNPTDNNDSHSNDEHSEDGAKKKDSNSKDSHDKKSSSGEESKDADGSSSNNDGDNGTEESSSPEAKQPGRSATGSSGSLLASACQITDLSVSVSEDKGTPGARKFILTFTNVSEEPCVLKGNPTVVYADSNFSQIGSPARPAAGSTNPTGTLLHTGESTNAPVTSVNAGPLGKNCSPTMAHGFLVQVPGDGNWTTVSASSEACTGKVQQLSVGQFGS